METTVEKKRRNIGASDAAALLGLSPYADAYTVWLDKTYQTDPPEDNKFFEWGRRLEPVILQKYGDDHDCVILKPDEKLIHPEHDFMVGYVDGRREDMPQIAVEAKTARSGWGNLSLGRKVQGIYYMILDGAIGRLDYAVFALADREMEYFETHPDMELQEAIVEICVRFWTHNVERHIPPEPDFANSGVASFIRERAAQQLGTGVVTEPEMEGVVSRIVDLKQQAKPIRSQLTEIDNRVKALEAEVLHRMDGADELVAGMHRVKVSRIPQKVVSYTRKPYVKFTYK